MGTEVNRLMEPHETAPALWSALTERYHQHAAADLIRSLDSVRELRYTGTAPFREHLAAFEARWDDLRFRSEDAPAPVVGAPSSLETAMRGLATSDEAKRGFLVASLPLSVVQFVRGLKPQGEGEMDYAGLRGELLGYCAWETAQSAGRGV